MRTLPLVLLLAACKGDTQVTARNVTAIQFNKETELVEHVIKE